MNKNIKLLYCILGSVLLAALNNPIFEHSSLGIFEGLHGINWAVVYQIYLLLINVLSFLGFILLIFFSIKLILNNIK
ncbi:MAG: hypothetical protein VB128_16185 [Sedimentibacter saalensis]|uniref:hypothetical protein n=1 Tax=Sedimentibacter saalensis TaxID=130788 RepID=UPI002B1EC86C|nr:hypothetical protein [Sedimentibacter saalensis]MEA5096492.1 hypothetical protein [Sedimentibacter saalensis]